MKRTRTLICHSEARHWLVLLIGFSLILLMAQLATAESRGDGSREAGPPRPGQHGLDDGPPPRDDMDEMGGPGGGRGGPGRRSRFEPTREQLLDVLRDINLEMAERIEQFSGSGKGAGDVKTGDGDWMRGGMGGRGDRGFGRMMPRLQRLAEEKQRDPALYELRVSDLKLTQETHGLARQLREVHVREVRESTDESNNDGEEMIEQLEDQIEETVANHFDVRQELRELELERLKNRIEILSEQLEEREDARDDLIERRVEKLIGRERGASW